MSRSFAEDYAFGKANENVVFNKIKNIFKDDITTDENPFAINDFKGTEYHYELKSRTNKHDDFPDTLLPTNKVFCDKHIFLFYFTDGLYYIVYNKKVFKKFVVAPFKRKQRIDFNDKVQLYYYIPIDKLIKLNI